MLRTNSKNVGSETKFKRNVGSSARFQCTWVMKCHERLKSLRANPPNLLSKYFLRIPRILLNFLRILRLFLVFLLFLLFFTEGRWTVPRQLYQGEIRALRRALSSYVHTLIRLLDVRVQGHFSVFTVFSFFWFSFSFFSRGHVEKRTKPGQMFCREPPFKTVVCLDILLYNFIFVLSITFFHNWQRKCMFMPVACSCLSMPVHACHGCLCLFMPDSVHACSCLFMPAWTMPEKALFMPSWIVLELKMLSCLSASRHDSWPPSAIDFNFKLWFFWSRNLITVSLRR